MATDYTAQFDWKLLIILVLLLIFGELALYSASVQKVGDKVLLTDHYVKQLIWIVLGGGVFILILYMPDIIIELLVVPYNILIFLALIAVLFLPAIKGVHRWISFGSVNIQPSEFAKLGVILLLAKIISKQYLPSGKIVLYTLLVIIPPAFLVLIQPDLGSALVFFAVAFPMMYFAGASFFTLFVIITPLISLVVSFNIIAWILFDMFLLVTLVLKRISFLTSGIILIGNFFISLITPFLWWGLHDYQRNRILAFINPKFDVLGSGYQIIQSKIAIGSGGIFGKGLLQGTQKNLNFLPEKHTDFIFSVIGEELGFFGCLILLLLFLALLWRIAKIIRKIRIKRRKLVLVGIFSLFVFQIVVNIGMNIGIIPVVGIPLPFISYGGSSLLVNMACMAIVFKYARERTFV
ncbi:MAG TPA: rod shape-determining protein RodA [Candidatus Cloacimonetes bacterium]|nr:rod shape-determining protein RodA [Candidatus Cloacimonadota bacterium]HEX38126.1 rod shape-determining protein RodA [Candidatus Cloacimonadota bacterium]